MLITGNEKEDDGLLMLMQDVEGRTLCGYGVAQTGIQTPHQ